MRDALSQERGCRQLEGPKSADNTYSIDVRTSSELGRPTGARPRASPRWTHRRTTSASINIDVCIVNDRDRPTGGRENRASVGSPATIGKANRNKIAKRATDMASVARGFCSFVDVV